MIFIQIKDCKTFHIEYLFLHFPKKQLSLHSIMAYNTKILNTYNANGALTKDTDRGRQISYNLLNLPKTVGIYNDLVNGSTYYHYSADGVKRKVVYQWIEETVRKPEINDKGTPPVIGVVNYVIKTTDYVGNKIYEDGALSMILFGNGYIKGGKYHFYIRDHLGNNRVIVRDSTLAIFIPGQIEIGEGIRGGVNYTLNQIVVVQRTDYYPSGLPFPNMLNPDEQQFKYNGKEFDTMHGLNLYDFGARFMDPALMRWHVPDPLAEKYYSISPYVYCLNNPLRFIDPDGRQIVGLTKNDALKLQQDFHTIFAGEQFENFRSLLTLDKSGTTFNSISADAVTSAFEGINLTTDQQALVNEVTGAINSEQIHSAEFVDINGTVSTMGTAAFKDHLNSTQSGIGDAMIPSANMPGVTMNAVSGGGVNIPTKTGSHSVIMVGKGVTHDGGRALTTGHEIIGHGVATANKVSPSENNTRAIRVDNLIRRVMGITTYRTEHGGAKIVEPNKLP